MGRELTSLIGADQFQLARAAPAHFLSCSTWETSTDSNGVLSEGSTILASETPQDLQANLYISNPWASKRGARTLRNKKCALHFGHSTSRRNASLFVSVITPIDSLARENTDASALPKSAEYESQQYPITHSQLTLYYEAMIGSSL